MSKRKGPEWLRSRWEQKKIQTVERIRAAVDQLRREGRDVTFQSIRDTVRSVCGVSISANTIKRNDLAYQVYLANRPKPKVAQLPPPALRQLIKDASAEDLRSIQSKVSRLRREPKDALIAKLVSLERVVARQGDAENRLREEILRLSDRR